MSQLHLKLSSASYIQSKIPGQEGPLRSGLSTSSSLTPIIFCFVLSALVRQAFLLLLQHTKQVLSEHDPDSWSLHSRFPLPGISFHKNFFLQNSIPWLIYLKRSIPFALSPLTVLYFLEALVTSSHYRCVHFMSSPLKCKFHDGLCTPVFPGPKTGPNISWSCKEILLNR